MRATERTESSSCELLRFITCGSVDDGKSTLIGRLLHDSKALFEDQLAAVARTTRKRGVEGLDLSLFTDGLQAEREQGITIDVAYRYFAVPRRKFIIADTPGHEQYTRNMVTGASTANLAVILMDARKGVLVQSRRHAYIASLLRLPRIVVAINKMDLVGYRRDIFSDIREAFAEFASGLGFREVAYVPISALRGDMVVERGENMPWYSGPTLMEQLENTEIDQDIYPQDLRFPVQGVCRPGTAEHGDFRGYMGRIESGTVRVGDSITILPTGGSSRVKEILAFDCALKAASAPQSVTLILEDNVDISRGDMIVNNPDKVRVTREVDADFCWLSDQPLDSGRNYLVKQTTKTVKARLARIDHRLNIKTMQRTTGVRSLSMNDIARVGIKAQQALVVDSYAHNRATGSFIMIDPATNHTVGAGMIV